MELGRSLEPFRRQDLTTGQWLGFAPWQVEDGSERDTSVFLGVKSNEFFGWELDLTGELLGLWSLWFGGITVGCLVEPSNVPGCFKRS